MSNLIDLNDYKKKKQIEVEEEAFLNDDNPAFFSIGYAAGLREGSKIEKEKTKNLISILFFINFLLTTILIFMIIK